MKIQIILFAVLISQLAHSKEIKPMLNQLSATMESLKSLHLDTTALTSLAPVILRECAATKLKGQEILIECNRRYVDLLFDSRELLNDGRALRTSIQRLPEPLSQAQTRMFSYLDRIDKVLHRMERLANDGATKMMDLHTRLLNESYDRAYRSGRDKGIIDNFCLGFNNRIQSTSNAVSLLASFGPDFGYEYLQVKDLVTLKFIAKELQPYCSPRIDPNNVDPVLQQILKNLNWLEFESYKKKQCQSGNWSADRACMNLQLNSFSAAFLMSYPKKGGR